MKAPSSCFCAGREFVGARGRGGRQRGAEGEGGGEAEGGEQFMPNSRSGSGASRPDVGRLRARIASVLVSGSGFLADFRGRVSGAARPPRASLLPWGEGSGMKGRRLPVGAASVDRRDLPRPAVFPLGYATGSGMMPPKEAAP